MDIHFGWLIRGEMVGWQAKGGWGEGGEEREGKRGKVERSKKERGGLGRR